MTVPAFVDHSVDQDRQRQSAGSSAGGPDSTQGPDLAVRALCSVSTRRALGRTRTCNLLIRS